MKELISKYPAPVPFELSMGGDDFVASVIQNVQNGRLADDE